MTMSDIIIFVSDTHFFFSTDHCQQLHSKVKIEHFYPWSYSNPYRVKARTGIEDGQCTTREHFRILLSDLEEIPNPDPLYDPEKTLSATYKKALSDANAIKEVIEDILHEIVDDENLYFMIGADTISICPMRDISALNKVTYPKLAEIKRRTGFNYKKRYDLIVDELGVMAMTCTDKDGNIRE